MTTERSESAQSDEVFRPTTYDLWVADQGIPVFKGFFIQDLKELPLGPWKQLGGLGSFVHLEGSADAQTDGYVGEIPPGQHLRPQKHLYETIIFVLTGQGSTTVWYDESRKHTFEWKAGSLFALPLNASYQLFNGSGAEPARFFAVTNAPLVMNLFHNLEFVFNDAYRFQDRFDERADFFSGSGVMLPGRNWETNFVPDVASFKLEAQPKRGGGRNMHFELANSTLTTHTSEFPVGTYKKAHRHGPGANVIVLTGKGYTLLWRNPGDPFQRVDWQPGSIFVPPDKMFHQHFNIGSVPARYLAIRWGSSKYRFFHSSGQDESVKTGGNQVEYEDEDPRILEMFAEECARHGVQHDMARFFPNRSAIPA